MSDSETLRAIFYSNSGGIEDGWTILSHGDDSECYQTDEFWVLKGPDGRLYEHGIDDQWNPIETNLAALKAFKLYEACRDSGLLGEKCLPGKNPDEK